MRKICVVTGTRAEYGLLYWLMKEIENDDELQLQLIATGMHLSPEFGLTYKLIEQDGFHIDAKVEMVLSSDTPVGIAKSIGLGVIGFADALDRLQPDLMVVLGDRYEMLAAAQAAMALRIPIAHLCGGETTEGVIDEPIRHCITKMSHLHFVGAEIYRNRVVQLGEDPKRVFDFGDPGLDNIRKLSLLSQQDLEKVIQFKFGKVNFLVTYHPVTLQDNRSEWAMKQLLSALDEFPEATIIFTKPNSDAGGRIISKMIDEYVHDNPGRTTSFVTMGQINYLSAMQYVDAVIGNSSSGIVESPFMKKVTVNIGDRQKGRLKAESIIDCNEDFQSIYNGIMKALSNDMQTEVQKIESLYGVGNTASLIKDCLKTFDLSSIVVKKFFDLGNAAFNR